MPKLCSGEVLGSFGLTEPEAGSDAGNVRTRAAEEDGEWVINGAKQFITNAGTDISGFVTITARTGDDEVSNILVPKGTPGYEIGEGTGRWAGTPRYAPALVRRCPRARRQPGRRARQGLPPVSGDARRRTDQRVGDGRGLAQGALDEALAYAKERRAFGQSISKFQAIQAKLADMSTEIEAARLFTYKAAVQKDRGEKFGTDGGASQAEDRPPRGRAAEEAVQIHGGYGYIEEYPVCRFYRDAKILTIGEGTDEVQQMVIARGLGA